MNDDRAFERATRDWLETGSDTTPPATVEAVLLAVRTTPQERDLRIPWRTPRMSSQMRLAAAIAIMAVVGFGGLRLFGTPPIGNAPTPSPTARPTPSPTLPVPQPTPINTAKWTAFTSARGGYSAKYPSDWTLTLATAPASLADISSAAGAFFDHMKAPSGPFDELMGVSTKLPAGMSQASWIAAYRQPVVDQFGAGCFPPPDQWKPVTVGGHSGGLYVGCNYVESTTFVDGRAYVFTITQPFGAAATASTEELLRAFLSTVTIDAAAANESPATSPGPT
ncbi:MAG: hypothetical protein HY264_03675 [Chloroflexi bacterium]|nr:hypothetical protein [Chloroflexota bacterium]